MGFDGSEMKKNKGEAIPQRRLAASVTEKSLPLAIGLNLLMPGLGYMYMGKFIPGFFALLIMIGGFMAYGLFLFLQMSVGINVLMAIDMIILANKNKKQITESSTKRCPNCAETIKEEARICRFCNTNLEII